jgi:hypothetical protein
MARKAAVLVLLACPDRNPPVREPFTRPPESWYLKKAIQSE